MSSVTATYKPQGSQTFRCSDNFPNWDPPTGCLLRFKVITSDNHPQPVFAVDHDKTGHDTRWYSKVQNESTFPVTYENGDPGGHSIYVGTTAVIDASGNEISVPDDIGDMTYTVIVQHSI